MGEFLETPTPEELSERFGRISENNMRISTKRYDAGTIVVVFG